MYQTHAYTECKLNSMHYRIHSLICDNEIGILSSFEFKGLYSCLSHTMFYGPTSLAYISTSRSHVD